MNTRINGCRCLLLVYALSVGTAVAMVVGEEEVIYYHSDAMGSPILATDSNGDVLWREQYSPYGSRLLYESREVDCGSANCEPVESPWDEKQWFTGKFEETRAGLQYFGARWYEAELGRFLSPDPVLFQDDNVFSFNRYAYANNNPYRYLDPDGREAVQVGISVALPETLGLVQKLLNREIKVSGFATGLVWSYPNAEGKGEYDIGFYFTSQLNGEGIDTGKIAVSYSQSVDDSASAKDVAGIGGGASIGLGLGGFDTSYSEEGFEMLGFHIGYGAGFTARGEATAVFSSKHGKLGWHRSVSGEKQAKRERNQDDGG